MNISTLSRLHTDCLLCGLQYFSLSHLNNLKCRLCNQKIETDNIHEILLRNTLNKAIEVIFPRYVYEFDYGSIQLYQLRRQSIDICNISNQYLDYYTRLRLKNRIRHGEWKSRRKKRIYLLAKVMSSKLNSDMIQYILKFMNWEEVSVLYRHIVFDKN